MAKIDDLLNDPEFQTLPGEEQERLIDELRQQDFGAIPNFEKVLGSLRSSQFGPFPFIPTSGAEVRDLPVAGAKGLSSALMGIPELVSGEEIEEPKTEYGKRLAGAAGNVPLMMGGGMTVKPIGALLKGIKRASEAKKLAKRVGSIEEVQKAFLPWVKKHTTEFGKSLKQGYKELIGQGKLKIPKEDVEAFINKLEGSKDTWSLLPKKVKDEVAYLKSLKSSATPQQLRRFGSRLRASISKGELKGTLRTERGRIVKEVDRDVRNYLNQRVPGAEVRNPKYQKFSDTRETMERLFKPGESTRTGEESLKSVKNLSTQDLRNLRAFETETGTNFLDPAKRVAYWGGVGKSFVENLPWYAGAAGLGGVSTYALGRILSNFAVNK